MSDSKPETTAETKSEAPSTTTSSVSDSITTTNSVEVDIADDILSPPTYSDVTEDEVSAPPAQGATAAAAAAAAAAPVPAAPAAANPTTTTTTTTTATTTTTTTKPAALIDPSTAALLAQDPSLTHKPVVLAGSSADAAGKPLTEDQKRNEMLYVQFLQEAQRHDYSDLEKLDFLYTCGLDDEGRSVVVLIGSNLPAKTTDLDRVFLYLIKTLDPVVQRDYVVVFVAANMSSANNPGFSWLRKVYSIFNRKFKKNLKKLYIIEAKSWVRIVAHLFMGVVSRKFWAKLVWVSPINDIFRHLKPSAVRFPSSLMASLNMAQPLFGVNLVDLARSNRNLRDGLPIVVSQCIHYLYDGALGVEGILRVPGDRTLVNEFKILYDTGHDVYLTRAKDPHTIASLLKMYLHDLPEPLLTKELHKELLKTQTTPNMSVEERVAAVAALLKQIPDINKAVLWNIITFARAVAERSGENKMTIDNIAVCLGPTLMWNQDVTDPSDIVREMIPVNGIMKILVNHPEIIPDTPFKIDPPLPPVKRNRETESEPTTTTTTTTSSNADIPPPPVEGKEEVKKDEPTKETEEKPVVASADAPTTSTESAPEAAVSEAPATEAPSNEAPAKEAPSDEAPAKEAPSDEAPAKEAPSDEASAAETKTETSSAPEEPAKN